MDDSTPLNLASGAGHLGAVKVLLDKGVDINAEDMMDWTPFNYASEYHNHNVIQLLVSIGAKRD